MHGSACFVHESAVLCRLTLPEPIPTIWMVRPMGLEPPAPPPPPAPPDPPEAAIPPEPLAPPAPPAPPAPAPLLDPPAAALAPDEPCGADETSSAPHEIDCNDDNPRAPRSRLLLQAYAG